MSRLENKKGPVAGRSTGQKRQKAENNWQTQQISYKPNDI